MERKRAAAVPVTVISAVFAIVLGGLSYHESRIHPGAASREDLRELERRVRELERFCGAR